MARLQHSLNLLEPWLYKWRIKVNVAKTQLVCFNQRSAGGKLTFCEEEVKESKEMKILGTTFDRGGSGREHCKQIAAKAMSRVNLLRRLNGQTWGTSEQKLQQFYTQFVRPVLENGYAFTANAKPASIQHLNVVQNFALRVILRADKRTRILDMEEAAGIPPIQERLIQLRDNASERYKGSSLLNLLETRIEVIGE